MTIKINNDLLEKLILLYPVLLGLIFLFNINPFFITAPYFFLILLLIVIKLLVKQKVSFPKNKLTNVLLTFIILLISIINFSSVRYSLPVMYAFFLFIFQIYTVSAYKQYSKRIDRQTKLFFIVYVVLSLFFLFFVGFSQMEVGDRFRGFTGSPTTYSAIIVVVYILIDTKMNYFGWKRILLYGLVFFLVYITKTRLILLFLIVYPLIYFSIKRLKISYGFIYIIFFLTLFFVYPVYEIIAEYFPNLIASRYEGEKDTSFGLRNYLFRIVENDFYSGNITEILFGKGNENSRIVIADLFKSDLMPHNDYLRVVNDWGIFGGLVFFIFIYRISKQNITALMISILYLLLFYSNMVFNLFLISVLMLTSSETNRVTKVESSER